MREIRLLVATPSARDWKLGFGTSLVGLTFQLARFGVKDCSLKKFWFKAIQGGMSRARQEAVNEALVGNYTHLLFIDDDIQFPLDVADRLISHNLPIVAANYARRHLLPAVGVTLGLDGQYVKCKGKTGLEKVGHIGLGMCLMETDMLRKIAHRPLFEMVWDDHHKDYWSEDMNFCNILRSEGIDVYIDHDISNEISHIGDFGYSFGFEADEVEQEQSIMEAAE